MRASSAAVGPDRLRIAAAIGEKRLHEISGVHRVSSIQVRSGLTLRETPALMSL
jgi:hypothetical protein